MRIITILFLIDFINNLKIKILTFSKRNLEKLKKMLADAAKNRICGCKSEKAWKYGRKSNKNALAGGCRAVFATFGNVAFFIDCRNPVIIVTTPVYFDVT